MAICTAWPTNSAASLTPGSLPSRSYESRLGVCRSFRNARSATLKLTAPYGNHHYNSENHKNVSNTQKSMFHKTGCGKGRGGVPIEGANKVYRARFTFLRRYPIVRYNLLSLHT